MEEKPNFFAIGPVVFVRSTQMDATELKEYGIEALVLKPPVFA
jgi:hypothetical protein